MRTILLLLLIGCLAACQQAPIQPQLQIQSDPAGQGLPLSDHLTGHQLSLTGTQVLLTGGNGLSFQPYLFDPATQTWQATDSTRHGYIYHGAVTLPDGRVLIAGGSQDYVPGREPQTRGMDRAEIWDPASQTWRETAPLTVGRTQVSLTLLESGKVLATGGYLLYALNGDERRLRSQLSAMAEIFDPLTETWRRVSLMQRRRGDHQVISLPDGRVLVLGGNPETLDGEIFDPLTEEWTLIRPIGIRNQYDFRAILLNEDQVLLTGGGGVEGKVDCYVYTLSTDSWAKVNSMNDPRSHHQLIRLENGNILAIGGRGGLNDHPFYPVAYPIASMELYDPTEDQWTPTTDLRATRQGAKALALSKDNVLVVGGEWRGTVMAEQITFR